MSQSRGEPQRPGAVTSSAVALVTGGATGIGAACCRLLAEAGFAVGIHYHQSEAAARLLSEELPGSFIVQADLATQEGIERIAQELKNRPAIEVLVNNAGITRDAPLFLAKSEDFDQIVATNMKSTWWLAKKVSKMMIRQRRGRIINISSVVASTGFPTQAAYGMSKAAIENLTRTLAYELAEYGILVNAVAPGFIETRMTEVLEAAHKKRILDKIPLARSGRPEEVASLVRYLATEGTYCTGCVYHVNGGMYPG